MILKLVSINSDYVRVSNSINAAIVSDVCFPGQVFSQSFTKFSFLTFDELLMPVFFIKLVRFQRAIGEERFWFSCVEPDPRLYFNEHFDFFGCVEFAVEDEAEEYCNALNNFPETSLADALAHSANQIVILSQSGKWAIYGNRDSEIAICAFRDLTLQDVFQSIYGADLFPNAESAFDFAYGECANESKDLFLDNYSA